MLFLNRKASTNFMLQKIKNIKKGSISFLEHESITLKNNPLGDPNVRSFPVYLPWQYNSPKNKHKKFPVLFDLAGFTGSGPGRISWKNFEESLPERLDRLISRNKLTPCIVVFPDCFTSLGGNQYINSKAIGRYADYLTQEIIPFVDGQLRTFASREHRGCLGKSSGGYGALVHGMKYPEHWGAIGSHAGDAYFDFVYKTEWPKVLTHLQHFQSANSQKQQAFAKSRLLGQGCDDGRIANFLEKIKDRTSPSNEDVMTLMMLAMAASYDPDLKAPNNFRVPYNLETGDFIRARWSKWLAHDPINLVTKYHSNLKKMKAIYIDCGYRDQFHIHFGARQLSKMLTSKKVPHLYEEFNGTHSGIDHRLDISLPYLSKHLL